MNIIKNRYLYFLISLLVIIPGLIFMGLNWSKSKDGPLPLGIDFRGGSLLEVQFEGTTSFPPQNNRSMIQSFNPWARMPSRFGPKS
jgi:preprotein translocase subunit SecF